LVNALNQYATVAGAVYTYDLDGNLAGDGVWSTGHDAEGRLVSATRAGTALAGPRPTHSAIAIPHQR
jgi:hypothetical protein